MRRVLFILCAPILALTAHAQTVSVSPNPFATRAVISYTIPADDTLSLTVMDFVGQVVADLAADSPVTAGSHQDSLVLANSPAGVYFVLFKLQSGYSRSMKVVKTDPLGLAGILKEAVTVFPNPTSGTLHITGPSKLPYRLINAKGDMVCSGSDAACDGGLDLALLESGLYILTIRNGDEGWVYQIIKE